jgi:hypothetical protein
LRELLDASEPAAGSVAHLRWEIDRAVQQLHLSALAASEEPPSGSTIQRLASGPLASEVRSALGMAAAAGPSAAVRRLRKATARSPDPPANLPAGEHSGTFGWTWPGIAEPLAGMAAAAVAYLAFGALFPFPTSSVEHRTNAYELEWVAPATVEQPGSLVGRRLATDAAVPADAELYRDDVRVGSLTGLSDADSRAVSNVTPEQRGAYYQLRAALPAGNLAVSNPVFVPGLSLAPAPPAPAASAGDPVAPVMIDFSPWARVRIAPAKPGTLFQGKPIEDLLPKDPLVTPFTLFLPPGSYALAAENGGVTRPLTLSISVEAGQPQIISRPMPGFDPNRLVDSLLSGAKQ